jgi:hypothetical protein
VDYNSASFVTASSPPHAFDFPSPGFPTLVHHEREGKVIRQAGAGRGDGKRVCAGWGSCHRRRSGSSAASSAARSPERDKEQRRSEWHAQALSLWRTSKSGPVQASTESTISKANSSNNFGEPKLGGRRSATGGASERAVVVTRTVTGVVPDAASVLTSPWKQKRGVNLEGRLTAGEEAREGWAACRRCRLS